MLGQRVHGTYGPTDQLTPAIRTATAQCPVGARRAEGALERADARLGRVRSKVPVATFAIRPQLEHGVLQEAGIDSCGKDSSSPRLSGEPSGQQVYSIRRTLR